MGAKYLIDCDGIVSNSVGGYIKLDRVEDLKNSRIAIVVGMSTNTSVSDIYKCARNEGNDVAIIVVGTGTLEQDASDTAQMICTMAVCLNLNIHKVELAEAIDEEYCDNSIEIGSSNIDIENYIGSSYANFNSIVTVYTAIVDAVHKDDNETVLDLIRNNKKIISSSVEVILQLKSLNEYVGNIVDTEVDSEEAEPQSTLSEEELRNFEEELENYKIESDKLNEKIDRLKKDVDTRQDEANHYRKESERLEQVVKDSKRYISQLEAQMSSHGPIVKTYATIPVTAKGARVQRVIYFKEVSYTKYVNTFVMNLMQYLKRMGGDKAKIKTVIYDYKNDFSIRYKPLPTVGINDFLAQKERLLSTGVDAFVVVEPNQAIIDELIRQEYDVLIIYDRMKQKNDIVNGNTVFKYWVINSKSDIRAVRQLGVDTKHVISGSEKSQEYPDCITIPEIEGYKEMTVSARESRYSNVSNNGSKTYESIMQRCSISL